MLENIYVQFLACKKGKKSSTFKVDNLFFFQWLYICNYYILCINVLSTYTVFIAIKWLIYDYINQYIFISIYSTEPNKKKSENKNKTKKHRKPINNSCLFKTQSHTIPEVLSSFGNSAYNIKKMKYKERASFTRIHWLSSLHKIQLAQLRQLVWYGKYQNAYRYWMRWDDVK